MEKRYLTKQLPSKWPFSHGVAIKSPGTIIILAGQVAFDRHGPNRQLVGGGDLAAQTRQAMALALDLRPQRLLQRFHSPRHFLKPCRHCLI